MEIIKRHALGAGLVVLSLALIGGVLYGSVEQWPSDGDPFEDNMIDTVGEIRAHRLDQITAEYTQENPQGELLVIDGRRLAPISYINDELTELNASWRVDVNEGEVTFSEVT